MKLNNFLAILILLSAAFGQLNRLFIGDGEGAVLYANDILVGVLAVVYLVNALIIRRSWKIPPVMVGIWLFLVFGGLGLLGSWSVLSKLELAISLSYLVRYLCYSFLFFVAYDAIVYAKNESLANQSLRHWLRIVLLASVLVAISGFAQLYLIPDLAILAQYGWDPHVNRLTTAMLDPNYAAAYLSIGLALSVSIFLYSKNAVHQVGLLALSAILLMAILLT